MRVQPRLVADRVRRQAARATPPWWVVWLAVVVAVAAATVVLLVIIPAQGVPKAPSLADRDRLAAQAAIRATILQAVGGLVLVLGLGFTARSVYVSRETHLTDRLTKAVEQLGHDKPEVRVGAVYALQRLARNSPVDRSVVTNILSGYLTIHAGPGMHPPTGRILPDVQTAVSVLVELEA